MAEFDESKHPRDNDGKFTSKDGVKEYRQNTSYAEILNDLKAQSNNSSLTKQEFAIWCNKLSANLYGEHVKILPDGHKVIPVSNKVVFSKGTFEEPIIDRVMEFDSQLELSIFMEIL